MELQTAEQINGPQIGVSKLTPSSLPKNAPIPPPIKHPLRFAIKGVIDKIPDLKATINATDMADGLKKFICDELDKMTSGAAEIHLHDVERSGGGFDLHVSVKSVFMGARKGSVFKKAVPDPAAS